MPLGRNDLLQYLDCRFSGQDREGRAICPVCRPFGHYRRTMSKTCAVQKPH